MFKNLLIKSLTNKFTLTLWVLFILFVYPVTIWSTSEVVTKEVTRVEMQSGTMMIYTPNEVFEITDSWLFFTFNSSDKYNQLSKLGTHTFKVAFFRVPFFSIYRTIVSIN